jgi:hypothetical protein
VGAPNRSTNTRRPGSMRQTSMRHTSLKNSSCSAASLDLFSALTEAPNCSADSILTHPHANHCEQKLGSLGVGGLRALLEVI